MHTRIHAKQLQPLPQRTLKPSSPYLAIETEEELKLITACTFMFADGFNQKLTVARDAHPQAETLIVTWDNLQIEEEHILNIFSQKSTS